MKHWLFAVHALKKIIDDLNGADFVVVQSAAATTGSVAIALALLEGRLSAEEAYHAACVDEIYQLKTWGDDAEAQRRLDITRAELGAIMRFHDLLKETSL